MTYERFEDLPVCPMAVWRASMDLGVQVYAVTANKLEIAALGAEI
jgi:hypothetical protein